MNYVLDTDTIIYFLKGHPAVVESIASLSIKTLHTTIINYTELLFGAFNSTKREENLLKLEAFFKQLTILPFCEACAYIFAEHKAHLRKKGDILADMDLMIASICMQNQMTLVTNNARHFAKLRKLKLENWTSL